MTCNAIFTIGHSIHSIDRFLALLEQPGITVVADVRSSPFSRRNPQYNRRELKDALKMAGVGYVFLGRELGARSDDPTHYDGNRVSYARLASSEAFHIGIDRVFAGAEEHRIALMCAEKEPLDCHRTILVARALADRGARIMHVLADGSVETHEAAICRLVKTLVPPTSDLFGSGSDPIAEALCIREQQIAHVRPEKAT